MEWLHTRQELLPICSAWLVRLNYFQALIDDNDFRRLQLYIPEVSPPCSVLMQAWCNTDAAILDACNLGAHFGLQDIEHEFGRKGNLQDSEADSRHSRSSPR